MALPQHPGIDMVHNMRAKAGYTQDWEVNQALDRDIMENLRRSKAFLHENMIKLAPEKVSDQDISTLRKFEVAIAYAGVTDPDSSAAQRRLANAIKGLNPTDQPLESTLYANRKAFAESRISTPASRVSTALEY